MASISGCAKPDEADLVGQLTPIIGVGDEEDTLAEFIEWPRVKGSRVEYPTGSSGFRHLVDEISLEYVQGVVKDSQTDEICCYLAQFDYGLTLPLRNLAKSVMNWIGDCPAQLNCNFWEVILVCETLNRRWAAYGSERRITSKDFLEYYAVKYVTGTDGAYLSSSSSRPSFFNLSSAGRVWSDNLLWVSGECLQRSDEKPLELKNITITKGINCKVSRKESFIDLAAREGTELEAILKEIEISRFKRVASKDDKVRRSQTKRRLAKKTLGSMEEKLTTPELNTPLKLMRVNKIPNGPVDVATVSRTVARNLKKRKAVKRGVTPHSVTSVTVDDSSKRRKVTSPTKSQEVLEESDKISVGADLRPRFEVEVGLLEEQCRAKAREKMVAVMDDLTRLVNSWFCRAILLLKLTYFFLQFARALSEVQLGFLDRSMELEKRISQLKREKEREAAALKLKEVRAESEAEVERLVTASAISWNNLAGKLYQLRYTKAEIMVFSEGNYEEIEIMDEEEVEEREDSLNVTEKTTADNQETINQELDVAKEGEEQTLLYNAEYLEEYEVLFSQYEDRLDDNVKLALRLEEAKRQADLRRLKGREAQSRADLAEIQAKNKSLVDDLAYARGNIRRVVQREREMNERINQLCLRISESKRDLRVCEMKYQKDLKFELDKRDGEIASAELAKSKAQHLKDNKRAAVTHQAFKEIVVHEQEKCDGEALHQRQLSALVAFFVEEIKFLQVERDLMQDCFSGRTCECKLDISSIDPIGVMDHGIGITTAEQIARGREIIVERAPEYIASKTEIGGSSSIVSPILVVGERSTALPSRKSCRVKKK
ncbi:hypothetical protein GIB67_008128 [Kingdonia uniflora]|uniref:Uncharacterized protein n=1 Tax=Kingdonia uniflora TaxID=39325 RepID=A0A7J7MST7_9MAGN|nr:hypothetical protein GIB67_008128 [Kingdonia uniflora]